jgi:DNA-binding NarL/FixJ family response regulator
MTIRVMLADDQALIRRGLRLILETEDDIEVVAEADDGLQAVSEVDLHRPDVVLMDIRMPNLDGIGATRRICSNPDLGGTAVLVLTTYGADEYVFEALRAGACGFVLKHISPEDLVSAVRTIAAGGGLIAPSITRRLIAEFANTRRAAPSPSLDGLTKREREVLELVGRGLSNAEIAAQLFLGEATVKTHLGHILTKLQLRDRVQAVICAYESGLISPSR